MVTPCSSASGRSASVASSATRDRSTGSGVKDRWSARLSRSSASVRSIARVLTTWRRSTSSSVSRFGSLRATSSRACVVASGVRSSWEALAANLRCSATLRFEPGEHGVEAVGELAELVVAAREPDPMRERSVRGHSSGLGDARQGSEHPAGEQPPADEAERPAGTPARRPRSEPKPCRGSERSAKNHHEGWRRAITPGRGRSAAGTPTRRRAAGRRRA